MIFAEKIFLSVTIFTYLYINNTIFSKHQINELSLMICSVDLDICIPDWYLRQLSDKCCVCSNVQYLFCLSIDFWVQYLLITFNDSTRLILEKIVLGSESLGSGLGCHLRHWHLMWAIVHILDTSLYSTLD